MDQAAVIEALRHCAQQLKAQHSRVVAVYLFGSFASGTATPRSDADIVVQVSDADASFASQVHDVATGIFLEGAPVPVDLFVMSSARLAEGRGVAKRVAQEGVRLA